MTIALVAIGAALGAILLTLIIQWFAARRDNSDERLTAVVREL